MALVQTTKSTKLYRKVEELHNYKPTKEELYYWYSGTHSSVINPNNPYRPRNVFMTRTYYEEVPSEALQTA